MVSQIASTLATRTRHNLLNRIADGSATAEDRIELKRLAQEQSKHTTGAERSDWLAVTRLAHGVTSARFSNGAWHGVDAVSIRAARTLTLGSGDRSRKYA